ncbi:hypothetical protein Tco_0777044 [Tanacetum coccineum]
MTNPDQSSAPPTLTLVEKLYAVQNINTLVLEKLDLAESNYSTWSYFFKGHCSNFGVLKHIEGSSTQSSTSTPPTDDWITADFHRLNRTYMIRLVPQDPANANWHMDTGASSHLNSSAHNLSTIFNSRMYPSVLVGDGKFIPVTNTGHRQVFRTVKGLIRCDAREISTPVTFFILTLSAFLYYGFFFKKKSDALSKFISFRAYVKVTIQKMDIKSLQCDHGGEFDNNAITPIIAQLRLNGNYHSALVPKNSHHKCKSERNDTLTLTTHRTLLFQAHLPPLFGLKATFTMVHSRLNLFTLLRHKYEIPHTIFSRHNLTMRISVFLVVFAIPTSTQSQLEQRHTVYETVGPYGV